MPCGFNLISYLCAFFEFSLSQLSQPLTKLLREGMRVCHREIFLVSNAFSCSNVQMYLNTMVIHMDARFF